MWGQTAGRTFFVGGGSSPNFDNSTWILQKSGTAMLCSSTCSSGGLQSVIRTQIRTLNPSISSSDSFEICCSRTVTLNTNAPPFPLAMGIADLTIHSGATLVIESGMTTVANLTNGGTLNVRATPMTTGALTVSDNFTNNGITMINGGNLTVQDTFTNNSTTMINGGNVTIQNNFTNTGTFNLQSTAMRFTFASNNNNMATFNGGTFTDAGSMIMRFQGSGSYRVDLSMISNRIDILNINCPNCTVNQTSLLMVQTFRMGNTARNAIYNINTTGIASRLDVSNRFFVHRDNTGVRFNLNRGIIQLGSFAASVDFDPLNGTFNGGSGTMNLNGNFNPSSGTFNGGSGIINLNGDFNPSGGTFNAQTSTVRIDVDLVNRSSTFSSSGTNAFTFYNLEIVNSNVRSVPQSFSCGAGEVIMINNNLILTGSSSSDLLTFTNGSSGGRRCIVNFKKAQSSSNFSNLEIVGIDASGSSITAFPIIKNASTTNVIDGGNNLGWFPLSTSPGSSVSLAITSAVASDQTGLDNVYNAQDTILISFSNDTNFGANSPNFNKTDIDNSLKFSQNLGNNYTGVWIDTRTLKVIIVDTSGATPPSIGSFNVALKTGVNARIKHRFATTSLNINTSILITGSFTHPNYRDLDNMPLSDVTIGPTVYRASLHSVINFRQVPQNTHVEVRDITGRKLYSITAFNQNFQWNVQGNNGMSLGSGVYFIYLVHGNQSRNIKFMVIR